MSEFINNVTRRKDLIKEALRQLHSGKSVEEVKAVFGDLVKEATYGEIAETEQLLIDEGLPVEEIQSLCDLHVAVFRDALDEGQTPEFVPGHPVFTFRSENQLAERSLTTLRQALEKYASAPSPAALLTFHAQLQKFTEYDRHYVRKENLLFPLLEKTSFIGPSKVMWGVQNDIRAQWKELLYLSKGPELADAKVLSEKFSALQTAIQEMFYKEDKILFPAAMERLSEGDWAAIRAQENEIGYFILVPGSQWKPTAAPAAEVSAAPAPVAMATGLLPLSTGALTLEQINLMLRNLPVDVTFVDENDEVRYFSQTRERIFDRTPAIIGRKVQNCHPPQSVDKVVRIVEDFRAGRRSVAEFWIQMGPKFVHIRYFALRDEQGAYRGTIEVSQEVSGIRALQGERRLLED